MSRPKNSKGDKSLLNIENLVVEFDTPEGIARAVEEVSFHIDPGETVGLVGESGCGKSVTSLSILGLIPSPPGLPPKGRIRFEDRDLLTLDAEAIRKTRGREISMIFQEPMTSLNPVLTIGRQVAEPLMVHQNLSRTEAMDQACRWLEFVKIPAAKKRLNDYPHQLSGGMRQRVMIAMALVCRPKLLIADEPTTALDVTIQSQILSLMVGLKEELDMSVLLITHDLGVIAQMAGRVMVMYAGQIVEQATVIDLFDHPFHPYTRGLLKSIPKLGSSQRGEKNRLAEIPGTVPPLTQRISGCKFAQRCSDAFDICLEKRPEIVSVSDSQKARCWLTQYPEKRR
jgi:oligopeptide/dipeptide ABC transporter ATP-binding protein